MGPGIACPFEISGRGADVTLRSERSGDLGPEPRIAFGREPRIEAADGRQRVSLRFPLTPHPFDIVADFVVTAIVAHCLGPVCLRVDGRITQQHDQSTSLLWHCRAPSARTGDVSPR